MRYIILQICILFSITSQAQLNESWFQYNKIENTYTIDAEKIHPSAFFRHFSLSSGIEIKYDKSISKSIGFYSNNGSQSEIISYLKKEFSTLITYKKNKDNKDLLTSISILPKGKFESSHMIVAVKPVEEVINLKENKISDSAMPIYLTRMEHLETRVRKTLERQAEHTIKNRDERYKRLQERSHKRKEYKNRKFAELERMKKTDPKLYNIQKSILNFKENPEM
jgi:hypothetical protein